MAAESVEGETGGVKSRAEAARSVMNLAAVALMRQDAALAFEVCRMLGELERDYYLASKPARPKAPMRIAAKYPGRCAVCSGPFGAGDPILYTPEIKRAVHEACR